MKAPWGAVLLAALTTTVAACGSDAPAPLVVTSPYSGAIGELQAPSTATCPSLRLENRSTQDIVLVGVAIIASTGGVRLDQAFVRLPPGELPYLIGPGLSRAPGDADVAGYVVAPTAIDSGPFLTLGVAYDGPGTASVNEVRVDYLQGASLRSATALMHCTLCDTSMGAEVCATAARGRAT